MTYLFFASARNSETEWPILFQSPKFALISGAKILTKSDPLLPTARNPLKPRRFPCCNTIGHSVSGGASMRERADARTSLYGPGGERKYLNAAERRRFLKAAQRAPLEVRAFCLVLHWSGGRISEVLALTPAAIDIESGVASIHTLKRRRPGVVRQVPLPDYVLRELNRILGVREQQRDPALRTQRVWRFSRTTAWRYVKTVMAAAGVIGAPAMPKGLRHSFGVNAIESGIPLHLLQRWLGHATLRTTAIYTDVIGPEERELASRMWRNFPKHDCDTITRTRRSSSR
jgi:integrase/recombinase XerD